MTQSDSPAPAPGNHPALSPDAPTLDVSVVLPVHNEAGHLRAEVDRIEAALEASPYSFEIIVVDDGSTDGSLDELADLAASGRYGSSGSPRTAGSGSARKAGTRAARGTCRRVDRRRHDVSERQIPAAREGARRLRPGRRRPHLRAGHAPRRRGCRRSGSSASSPRSSSRTQIPDLNSGFRAFRTDVALQYVSQLPAGFSLRHDDHDDVPRERLLGEVRADRVRARGRGARSSTGGATPVATSRR